METEIRRILIVDDNADYRKLLSVRLKSMFPKADIKEYDILEYGLPPSKFDWEKYDVLILDYFLGKDEIGSDWFKKYKKSEYFPATVLITGMHDEDTAAVILKSGIHHYLRKENLTKNEMYEGIEKALAVRASIIEEYKNQSNQEYDFDTFLAGFLIKTEERLVTEILRDARLAGCLPDRQLIDAGMARERQDILKLNDDLTIREAKIGILDVVAERILNKAW